MQLFHQGPFKHGTNNVGEFLALVHALALLQKENRTDLPISYDYLIAIVVVKRNRANTRMHKREDNT